MPISAETFERVALEDPDGKWELYCGQLRRKPGMTTRHNHSARRLGYLLQNQLDWGDYEVSVDEALVRRPGGDTFTPDVIVIPAELVRRLDRERPTGLEVYDEPLPLIVEVWSPSTGEHDRTTKLHDYQARGDAEIWLLHPNDRTLTSWRRQPDGSYTEQVYRGGVVHATAIPAAINLDELFII